jgi:hypothetical protein
MYSGVAVSRAQPTNGRKTMLLRDKIAIVYGGGGAIGGAVARVFAREGVTGGDRSG